MTIEEIQQEIKSKKRDLHILEVQLKEATKDKIQCRGCGSFFSKNQLMRGQFTELVKGECVYSDAGYGDTDEYADVTYLHTITRCPKCGYQIAKNSMKIKEENRWSRFDR